MARKVETNFYLRVKKRLEKLPGMEGPEKPGFFFKTQMRALRGVPDVLGVYRGRSVALEFKVDSPVEPLQTWTLKQWALAGAYARVVTPLNLEEVLADLAAFPRPSTTPTAPAA